MIMDVLTCSKCGVIFHELELFVRHKVDGCLSKSKPIPKRPEETGRISKRIKSPSISSVYEESVAVIEQEQVVHQDVKIELNETIDLTDDMEIAELESKQIEECISSPEQIKVPCKKCVCCLKTEDCGQCDNCKKKKENPNMIIECFLRKCELEAGKLCYYEKIVGKRYHNGRVEYLLKWKDCPESENSWEPKTSFFSRWKIENFEKIQEQSQISGECSSNRTDNIIRITQIKQENLVSGVADVEEISRLLGLPNIIQIIKSPLPLSEVENMNELVGEFLLRQIVSPINNFHKCLLCSFKNIFQTAAALKIHYQVYHKILCKIYNAKFSTDIVFVFVGHGVTSMTTLNSVCKFCGSSLKNLSEIESHYPGRHGQTVRLIPDSSIASLCNFLYCCSCSHPSADFASHIRHVNEVHRTLA